MDKFMEDAIHVLFATLFALAVVGLLHVLGVDIVTRPGLVVGAATGTALGIRIAKRFDRKIS